MTYKENRATVAPVDPTNRHNTQCQQYATNADASTEILHLRQAIFDHGFAPVELLTGQKHTLDRGWQEPQPRPAEVRASHLNTGILCAGLRVIDVDIDAPAIVASVAVAARRLLGPAPWRARCGSPRRAYLYRAADGQPSKRAVAGQRGAVEVLGKGQQLHAYGRHPGGAFLEWPEGGPADVHRADLPSVTDEALEGFLRHVAPIIGATMPEPIARRDPPAPIRSRDGFERHVLTEEAARIAGCMAGQEVTLNARCYRIGKLIGQGRIAHEAAVSALLDAGLRMPNLDPRRPWTRSELAAKIERALRDGRAAA